VIAGRLRARVVDHGKTMLLEREGGAPAAAIEFEPRGGGAPKLHAKDGEWRLEYVASVPRHRGAHLSARAGNGVEAATVWREGAQSRIDLPAGNIVLRAPSLLQLRLWDHTIEGLLTVRPSLATFGKSSSSRPRRPFDIRVATALAARPDASLVVLLASYLVDDHLRTAAA
jgi:hypothetical protein